MACLSLYVGVTIALTLPIDISSSSATYFPARLNLTEQRKYFKSKDAYNEIKHYTNKRTDTIITNY